MSQPSDRPRFPNTYDVAIVGGGIVGLTLALSLKTAGLRIALIEARPPKVALQQRRAYAITLMTGRIFQSLGIWDEILPHITTFQQIHLAQEHYPETVLLQPQDLGTSELGYVAEHPVLLRTLQAHLTDAETVTPWCPAELCSTDVQPDGVTLRICQEGEYHDLRAQLVVAADGSRSPLRQAAQIKTQGWQYWQSCITAVIRPEKSHGNIAREHFWASGPFATLPLPGNRCQIVLTAPHAEAQAWMAASPEAFLHELDRRYAGQLGRLELVGDRALFPVQLMHSQRYVQPRLALVGDAAHCCHPVGGQGLNLGIRDAATLAWVLRQAFQQGNDLGDLRVLRQYERWRKPENWAILAFTDFLDRSFSNAWGPLVGLRRLGLWSLARVDILKTLALRLMTGLSGRSPVSNPK